MTLVLVGTESGCRVFSHSGERQTELADRQVSALSPGTGSSCHAVVDGLEMWRRDSGGEWLPIATSNIAIQSLTSVKGTIYCGGMDEAVMLRLPAGGRPERLIAFDNVAGRSDWFAGGPPLGVRSLATTADGSAILAAVHVGGIPRSSDGGESWTPTIPILFDVHEVRAHPSIPTFAAAAGAVGLIASHDAGRNWTVVSDALETANSLAVAVLDDEVLFSIQDGPFAKRSQLWRWRIDDEGVEQVRDGLPEWLDGKVDTGWIVAGDGRVALIDAGGNLWLSKSGSRGWERIATGLPYALGLIVVQGGKSKILA